MANVTTTIAANFIPEIWANRALEVLKANIVLAGLVTRDTDMTGTFQVGDILHIPYPGTFTANDKAADTAVTLQTPSGGSEVQVTLNKHKEVSFVIEDVVKAQQNQSVMDRYIQSAAIAMAEQLETDLFALYSGLSQSVGTSGSDITEATVLSAKKELDDEKVSRMNRHLVVSSAQENALLQIDRFTRYDALGDGTAIREGAIGQIHGFTVHMSQLVPVVTGTPDSVKNLAFHPEAFILAMRALPNPDAGARSAVIRDPDSGIVIRVLYAYNPSYLGVQVTLDMLYGVAELRDAAGVVVLS